MRAFRLNDNDKDAEKNEFQLTRPNYTIYETYVDLFLTTTYLKEININGRTKGYMKIEMFFPGSSQGLPGFI